MALVEKFLGFWALNKWLVWRWGRPERDRTAAQNSIDSCKPNTAMVSASRIPSGRTLIAGVVFTVE
jgi:hypothetical protein